METRESGGAEEQEEGKEREEGKEQEEGKEREEGKEDRPPVEGGEHGSDEAKAAAPT